MKSRYTILSIVIAATGLTACDDKLDPVQARPDPIVTVTPATTNVVMGSTVTLTANVQNDTTGALSGVTWASVTPTIATVATTSGVVTGVGPGTVMIVATSKYRSTASDTSVVTVTAPVVPAVVIAPRATSLMIGQKQLLSAAGDVTGFTWISSAPGVASVSATGEVTALSAGTAIITATAKSDGTKSGTAQIGVCFPTTGNVTLAGCGFAQDRYTAEIAVRGKYAYTTTWGTRAGNRGDAVRIWDISGTNPVLVDSLIIPGVGTTSDVQVSPDSSLLVVSTEQLSTGSIAIYSLANPAAPTLISRYSTAETLRGVHTVKLSMVNNKLYGFLQINQSGVAPAQEVIVDLSNPASPQQVYAQAMGKPFIHDVIVRDGILFTALWNDGMSIFDIGGGGKGGTPANPVLISNIKTTSGEIHNIWWYHDPTNNNKQYVFMGEESAWNGVIGSGGISAGDIHVVDISNIAAPKEVATYKVPNAGTHNFAVDEQSGILYAAYYNGGVRALDIRGDLSTCTVAQQSATVSVTGAPLCDLSKMGREAGSALSTGGYFIWGVALQGNRLYASDMGRGIVALDISALKR